MGFELYNYILLSGSRPNDALYSGNRITFKNRTAMITGSSVNTSGVNTACDQAASAETSIFWDDETSSIDIRDDTDVNVQASLDLWREVATTSKLRQQSQAHAYAPDQMFYVLGGLRDTGPLFGLGNSASDQADWENAVARHFVNASSDLTSYVYHASVCPSVYAFYYARSGKDELKLYTDYARQNVQVWSRARALYNAVGRVKILPTVWPYFHSGGNYDGHAIPEDYWAHMLETLYTLYTEGHCDGALIWLGNDVSTPTTRYEYTPGTTNAATWAAVTDGHFRVTLQRQAFNVTGVDFTGDASMDDVAATLQAAINASAASNQFLDGDEAVVVWEGVGGTLNFSSAEDYVSPNEAGLQVCGGVTAATGSPAGTDLSGVSWIDESSESHVQGSADADEWTNWATDVDGAGTAAGWYKATLDFINIHGITAS